MTLHTGMLACVPACWLACMPQAHIPASYLGRASAYQPRRAWARARGSVGGFLWGWMCPAFRIYLVAIAAESIEGRVQVPAVSLQRERKRPWHVVGPGAASRNRPPSETRRSASLQSPVRRPRLPSSRNRAAVFVDEDSASRQLVVRPSRQRHRQCGKTEQTVAGQASHRICVYARICTHSRIHLPIHYCISTHTHTHTRTDGWADKTVTGAGWGPSLTASRLRPRRALLLIGCGSFRGARLGSASARMKLHARMHSCMHVLM
jgi:hypothetical protein